MLLLVLFYVLCLWQTQVLPQRLLNIYSTNNREDDYCLFYYVRNEYKAENAGIKAIKTTHQIIPYCLRLSKDILIADRDLNNTTDRKLSFAELRKANITSQQLISWSSPIDQAERYRIYLNSFTHSLSPSLSFENEISFYNCTSPSHVFHYDEIAAQLRRSCDHTVTRNCEKLRRSYAQVRWENRSFA